MSSSSRQSRRRFLAELAALTANSAGVACNRRRDREHVLRALVHDVAVPNVRALVKESRRLQEALHDAYSLSQARPAFQPALLAWKRASTFLVEPLRQSNALLRAAFWPVRTHEIDALLTEDPQRIDERRIEALSADVKGIFGLEYVLFGLWNQERAQPRFYAERVCANILGYAERGARLLDDGDDYADQFAAAGQVSLDIVVTQMGETLEALAGRLDRVARRRTLGGLEPADVEGYYSGTSLHCATELLGGTAQLYFGADGESGGVRDLVAQFNPPLDVRLKAAFRAAEERLSAILVPLEQGGAAVLGRAAEALRAVERTVKVEVRSAVGVAEGR